MEITTLKPIVEAMIFVCEEPITEGAILAALAEDGVSAEELRACLAAIEEEWNGGGDRGIGVVKVAGGYQFRTKPEMAERLRRLAIPKPMRLSAPALETLAIVAYRQPIMRSEIEKVRGVDSGGVLKTLLERRLLRIVGRSSEPGQPLLYGTTKEFLEIFNLNTLKELPTLKDIDDLLRERREQQAGAAAGEGKRAEGDEEDVTEILDDEGEEETEVIRRRPLDEDEEEEEQDMEALSELEGQLKSLRRLERHIFPKPIVPEGQEAAVPEGAAQEANNVAASEATPAGEAAAAAEGNVATPADDPATAHPFGADDSPLD
jgi:segregation and condensation protein B